MAAEQSTGALDRPVSDPDTPVPYSLTPAAERLPRRVSVSVLGRSVVVDCPPWCVASHDETLVTLDDLCHEGERISLAAPTYSAGTPRDTEVLVANIAQYPFSRGTDAEPHLVLDATSDGETAELGVTRVLAFLDQMAAHAERIRRQVRHLTPTDEPLIGPAARRMGARLHAEDGAR